MSRYITVKRPLPPRVQSAAAESQQKQSKIVRPAGCRTVFVKNLPYDATEDAVRQALMVCGPIATVRLPSWGHTGQLKGFGYVEFKREESSEIAVKKSGLLSMSGRALVIDFETGAAKGSFRPPRPVPAPSSSSSSSSLS